jgi:hypothetical protein
VLGPRQSISPPCHVVVTRALYGGALRAAEADLLASLIEEEDFTASLGETLFQVARRVEPVDRLRPQAGIEKARH